MVYRGYLFRRCFTVSEENREVEEKSSENVAVKDEEVKETVEEVVEESAEETQIHAEIESLKKEKSDMQDRILRLQAEFENYKRRTNKERADERKYKSQD